MEFSCTDLLIQWAILWVSWYKNKCFWKRFTFMVQNKYLLKDILNKKSCYDSHSSWQASSANTITFQSFFVNIWSHNQWRTTGETSKFTGFQKLNMARSVNNCENFSFTTQQAWYTEYYWYYFYSKSLVLKWENNLAKKDMKSTENWLKYH